MRNGNLCIFFHGKVFESGGRSALRLAGETREDDAKSYDGGKVDRGISNPGRNAFDAFRGDGQHNIDLGRDSADKTDCKEANGQGFERNPRSTDAAFGKFSLYQTSQAEKTF